MSVILMRLVLQQQTANKPRLSTISYQRPNPTECLDVSADVSTLRYG